MVKWKAQSGVELRGEHYSVELRGEHYSGTTLTVCDLQKSSKQGGGSSTEHPKLVTCWKRVSAQQLINQRMFLLEVAESEI